MKGTSENSRCVEGGRGGTPEACDTAGGDACATSLRRRICVARASPLAFRAAVRVFANALKTFAVLLALEAATMRVASSARAESDSPPASIRVEVQMVSVSPAAALSLVPALSDEKTIEEANARLQKMIASDEATLLGWPVLWLQSGVQSVSMTAEECRYPTEFNPPQVSSSFVRPSAVRPAWGESVPTTFETRNLGCDLEAQGEVDADGSTISLILAPSFVRLLGFDRFRNQTSPLGIEGEMSQPRFFRSAARNWIRVRNGRLGLLNVFVVPKPEPHVELFIVRAKATLLNGAKSTPFKK